MDTKIVLEIRHFCQASIRDKDRRDKPRGIEGDRDRDGIGMENSEP